MTTGIGASVGGLIGFLIGGIIPSEGEIAASFFGRITGNAISTDPIGLLMSTVYVMIAVSVGSALGGAIGWVIDSLFNNSGGRL